jgi:hypothetical protein
MNSCQLPWIAVEETLSGQRAEWRMLEINGFSVSAIPDQIRKAAPRNGRFICSRLVGCMTDPVLFANAHLVTENLAVIFQLRPEVLCERLYVSVSDVSYIGCLLSKRQTGHTPWMGLPSCIPRDGTNRNVRWQKAQITGEPWAGLFACL